MPDDRLLPDDPFELDSDDADDGDGLGGDELNDLQARAAFTSFMGPSAASDSDAPADLTTVSPSLGGFHLEESTGYQAVLTATPPLGSAPVRTSGPLNRDDPSGNALRFRVVGGFCVLLAPFIAVDADSRSGLIAAAVFLLGGLLCFFYFGSVERLRREQVVDRWDFVIDDARGRDEHVMTATIARLDQLALSQVQAELRPLAASLLRPETRRFLVVTHQGNHRLRAYRMHINVRDYGTSLQTSWYLSYHRGFFEKFLPDPLVTLDLFDEQDLRAYVTVVHRCLIDTVIDLFVTLGRDASAIQRNSRGFLGIS